MRQLFPYWQNSFALPRRPINQFKPVKQSRQQVLRFYCPNIFVAMFSSLPQFILQLFSAVRTIRCRAGGNRVIGGGDMPLCPFLLKFMIHKLTICYYWICAPLPKIIFLDLPPSLRWNHQNNGRDFPFNFPIDFFFISNKIAK